MSEPNDGWTKHDDAVYKRALEIYNRWGFRYDTLPPQCSMAEAIRIARDELGDPSAEPKVA